MGSNQLNVVVGGEMVVQPVAVVGFVADQSGGELFEEPGREGGVDAIIHFAASAVVPDSVAQPLAYYRNNTVNSRALIETAIKGGVKLSHRTSEVKLP